MLRYCSGLPSGARIGAVLGWCALLFLAGCGNGDPRKRVTVTGKVTLDGQPLTGGFVRFIPVIENSEAASLPRNASMPFTCELGDDGSFTLQSGGKSGAPLGKYRVQLEPGDKSDKQQWSKVPAAYKKYGSPLKVEIAENKPEGGYDLQLSSKDRPQPLGMKELLKEKSRSGSTGKP